MTITNLEFISDLVMREIDVVRKMRLLDHIVFNDDTRLSIQASAFHYCSPKELTVLHAYDSMEVALIKDGNFVSVYECTENEELSNKFDDYFDGGSVYAYVPVNLIDELYVYLRDTKGLK